MKDFSSCALRLREEVLFSWFSLAYYADIIHMVHMVHI